MPTKEDKDPNLYFRTKVGGGEDRLRILLSKKVQSSSTWEDIEDPVRGTHDFHPRPKPPDEIILKRRGEVVINFYDLGTYNYGSAESPGWGDLDWNVDGDRLMDTSGPLPWHITDLTDSTFWDSLKTAIFQYNDLADWDWLYRKFEYNVAGHYGVDVYTGPAEELDISKQYGVGVADVRPKLRQGTVLIDGANWVEGKGFVFPSPPTSMAVLAEAGFLGFGKVRKTSWPETGYLGFDYYITNTDDPNADPVSFTWDGNIDIFLVPCPVFLYGAENDADNSNYRSWFGMNWRVLPRNVWLENTTIMDYWYSVEPMTSGIPGLTPFTYRFFNTEIDDGYVLEAYDDARTQANSIYYLTDDLVSAALYPRASYPTRTALHDTYTLGMYTWLTSADWYSAHLKVLTGTLLAVVRKNNNWYYIWSNEDAEMQEANTRGYSVRSVYS